MEFEQGEFDRRLNGRKIAITGHRGFVGRSLVAALEKLDVEALLLEGDVRAPETWSGSFDLLFHLAASMPRKFAAEPTESFSVNIEGTLRALEACRERAAQLVFTSTCGVYSPEIVGAVDEEDALDPQSPYAQSKLQAEMLCRSYAENYGVKSTVLRIFNVYGPGQDRNYIIPYIAECILADQTAVVHNPQSARDHIYITDVVDALKATAAQDAHFDIFNVGTGAVCSNTQLIEKIEQVVGKDLSWGKKKGRVDNQPVVYAEVEKAAQKLEWRPETTIDQGLGSLVASMKTGTAS